MDDYSIEKLAVAIGREVGRAILEAQIEIYRAMQPQIPDDANLVIQKVPEKKKRGRPRKVVP